MSDDIHDLTGAYALDALEPDERAFFERHLADCAACRAEVGELREAAASLSVLVEEAPPPRMRAAVLSAIADPAQEDSTAPVEHGRRRRVDRLLPAVAAVLAVAVLGLGATLAYLLADRRGSPSLPELVEGAQVLALTGEEDDRGAVVSLVDGAVLVVTGLEPLPASETYQAWIIHDGTPRSAGLLSAPGGAGVVHLDDSVETADAIAVSREAAGGADAQPQGPIVLSWTEGGASTEQ